MPVRVSEFSLSTTLYARVQLPSFINLDPEDAGHGWWVKWNTLYYHEKGSDGRLSDEVKQYDLGHLDYDGDYKRPEIEDVEEEDYTEEVPDDIEEAMEAWDAYQNDGGKSDEWVALMEHKIALYQETMADIARGK